METNLKFNSAICTSREQSEQLLALGLKKETADMVILEHPRKEGRYFYIAKEDANWDGFPAWSLHRLLELFIEVNGNFFDWEFEISPGKLIIRRSNRMMFIWSKNVYDSIITCIEWLIKSGYFNKEYLEE